MCSSVLFRLDVAVRYKMYSRLACLELSLGYLSNCRTAHETIRALINSSSYLDNGSSLFILSMILVVCISVY